MTGKFYIQINFSSFYTEMIQHISVYTCLSNNTVLVQYGHVLAFPRKEVFPVDTVYLNHCPDMAFKEIAYYTAEFVLDCHENNLGLALCELQ